MNQLSVEQRASILAALVDGNSVRATCRICGVAKGTVLKLVAEIGAACKSFHDREVRDLATNLVQCDEIWAFCYGKERNLAPERQGTTEFGEVWTFTALDPESKLMIGWHVGKRTTDNAVTFMNGVAKRLANRVQLTTDGHHMYLKAVERAFGWDGVDYAMLEKHYASPSRTETARYSPPKCTGATKTRVMGNPSQRHVTTSHIERHNLTLRMTQRRFTRLTNAFSKKMDNHAHAVALAMVHYNYCRPHMTLTKANGGVHTTPAMVAGLTDHVWSLAEVVALMTPAEMVA